MTTEFNSRRPTEAITRHAASVRKRRGLEHADALDFLVYGDEGGRHSERCVHPDPCSRTYDPLPYPEAEPDARMYEGTGIGALYGAPGAHVHLWSLAGWNIQPRSSR